MKKIVSLTQRNKKQDNTARNRLKDILCQIKNKEGIISLNGYFHLTKSEPSFSQVYLQRDMDLEEEVQAWIKKRTTFKSLIGRYYSYDRTLTDLSWPQHLPVRIISGVGPISSGSNIFMFFPNVLGITAKDDSEYFGFEFVDVWKNIFEDAVFPCVQSVFDPKSQIELILGLKPKLEKTIFLASIFHELGHRTGPWKVSTKTRENMHVTGFHLDVMGELSTDSLLVRHLHEFPEVALFVTLQRLFWFGRRGFRNNPISGQVNRDNDAWIGAYLWNRLIEKRALKEKAGGWTLDITRLRAVYEDITCDVDLLGSEVLALPAGEQIDKVDKWMKDRVSWSADKGFSLPKAMAETFGKCYDILETPEFKPTLNLNDIKGFEKNLKLAR